MLGTLERGGFPRLAYRLGRGAATGELLLIEPSRTRPRHVLSLRRGYLCAANVDGAFAPLGQLLREAGTISDEQLRRSLEALAGEERLQGRLLVRAGVITEAQLDAALRRQAELRLERLCTIGEASWRLEAHATSRLRGGRPVSLAAWARRHLEARLDALRARLLCEELAGARLALRKDLAPDPAECDDTDRRILDALAAPRRLDELERASRAPRLRLLSFVWFLARVGALDPLGVAAPARDATLDGARRALGLSPGADVEAARRAYLRLARRLHPDMHPGADEDARRALAARFAAVTDAYRALSRPLL